MVVYKIADIMGSYTNDEDQEIVMKVFRQVVFYFIILQTCF